MSCLRGGHKSSILICLDGYQMNVNCLADGVAKWGPMNGAVLSYDQVACAGYGYGNLESFCCVM